MRNYLQFFISLFLIGIMFTGCATVFKGYEDRVDLVNASDSLKVYSKEGVEIPVSSRTVREYSVESKKFEDKKIKSIELRPNKEHILLLKSNKKEKLVELYPKIKGSWLILDIITGVIPAFIDAYTGNWNSFQPIIVGF